MIMEILESFHNVLFQDIPTFDEETLVKSSGPGALSMAQNFKHERTCWSLNSPWRDSLSALEITGQLIRLLAGVVKGLRIYFCIEISDLSLNSLWLHYSSILNH